MSEVLKISDVEFDDKVLGASSDVPVLVDFWAEWCGPCKMIAPILDQLASEYSGRLSVVKLNVDDSPVTAQRYGIRSIPTLMLFKNGEVEGTKVGSATKLVLTQFIENYL